MILAPFLGAALAFAAGPADLSSLRQGERIGSFVAEAVYLDPAGAPKGARVRHDSGLVVDALFFESIPQVSAYWRTPPEDDRGESHTLEHLLLGKGRAGRVLNTLAPMRLGDYSALTYSDVTVYQVSSAAGPAEFYELLEAFLSALLRPDFTDEEARREVAHVAAVEDETGALHLEEKGTVYGEMLSSMERADSVAYYQLARALFGAGHPLAFNQGGEPPEIWKLSPADIRAYHAARYHVGPNMELAAGLPMAWDLKDFLGRLDEILRRAEPDVSTRAYAGLPPFRPEAERSIRIAAFPSEDPQVPQTATLAWPPVEPLSREEAARASLALSLVADGESAYLYRDLVDQKTRKLDVGATGTLSGLETDPATYASISVGGLPVESITPEGLGRLRAAILERLRWLHGLKAGGAELAQVAAKARARIRSARRGALKAMDGPPGFGGRFTGVGWQRALDSLAREPGFAKRLDQGDVYDRLLEDLDAGLNPWAAALSRLGLLEPPYVSAARPDAELLKKQRDDKAERLRTETGRLARLYDLGEPEALARFRLEEGSATARLEELDRGLPRPAFLKKPPLTLDELDWSRGRLKSGPRIVRTRFASTPFTDLHVAFDLTGIAEEDVELLPLLTDGLGRVGAVTASGERLDYAQAESRIEEELYGIGVGAQASPRAKRYELTLSAAASSPEEVERAAGWLESFILRPALGPELRERLADLARARIQELRGLFQQDEEHWIQDAAAAYRWQSEPLYMALESPFTELRRLNRLRWRLEEPAAAELSVLRASMTAVAAAARDRTRDEAAGLLAGVGGELGEYLRWELGHLPEDSWRADLGRIVLDWSADVGRSTETVRRLQELSRSVLVRSGARAHVNGNPRDVERGERLLDALLARLPAEGVRHRRPKPGPLVLLRLRERLPGVERPVHVALVHEGAKTGSISVTVAGPEYEKATPGAILDTLAYGVLAGGGAQSLFLKTWGAGLAYGNGLGVGPAAGRVSYYAERSPDLAQTLRFVAETAEATALEDRFQLEYSLADAFRDYRAGSGFSERGAALAVDVEEGRTPETIRRFKRVLLEVARSAGALGRVRARFKPALGRVLIGLNGGKVASAPGAAAFVVAPEDLILKHEAYLRSVGEADRVIRLYPRDFWP